MAVQGRSWGARGASRSVSRTGHRLGKWGTPWWTGHTDEGRGRRRKKEEKNKEKKKGELERYPLCNLLRRREEHGLGALWPPILPEGIGLYEMMGGGGCGMVPDGDSCREALVP